MVPRTESRPVEELRADAARNLRRIVEVAARALGDDPGVGMAEVALAAGVSRATVYRHFPTRESLVAAIRRQAAEQGERALAACRLEEGTATEALERLVAAWLDVADRYAFGQLVVGPGDSDGDRERRRHVLGDPLRALIARGQATGEFSASLAPEWAVRVFGALLLAGARALRDGTLDRADAPAIVSDTLLEGLRA